MNTQDRLQLLAKLISELTLSEASELIKILKNEYSIELIDDVIAKPVYITPGDGDYNYEPEKENRTHIFLEYEGPYRLNTLKCIKDEYGLGLKEAKDLMDSAPCKLPARDSYKSKMILEKLQEQGAHAYILNESLSFYRKKCSRLFGSSRFWI